MLVSQKGHIAVPSKFQNNFISRYHDHKLASHLGIAKTLATIKGKYFWPRMIKQIKTYIRNCLTCAKRKAHQACRAPTPTIPISDYIWERIAMDIMGPLPETNKGNKYILVIMEYVMRYVIATPLKDITVATAVRKFIKHVVMKEGVPSEILIDQRTKFQSTLMKELWTQLGIKQLRTTAYDLQTDGAVEKFNRTLADMLATQISNEPRMWDIQLDYCIACYNQTIHYSTNETPSYLLNGRDPLEPTDLRPPMRYRGIETETNIFSQNWHDAIDLVKAHLVISQNKQKQIYDKNTKPCSFKNNQLVLLKEVKPQTGKFYMRWDGPYSIVEKLSPQNYLIRKHDSNTPFVVHVNRLKKWYHPTETSIKTSNVVETPKITNDIPDNQDPQIINDTSIGENPTKVQGSIEPPKRKRGKPRKPTHNPNTEIQPLTPTRHKYNLREKTKKPT